MDKKVKFYKQPLVWFSLLPFLVVSWCGYFVDISPRGFHKILIQQDRIEAQISEILVDLKKYSQSELADPTKDREVSGRLVILKELRLELAQFKTDWGSSLDQILRTHIKKHGQAAGEKYQPFLFIMMLAIIFNLYAIAPFYRKIQIPFYMQAGFFSTGCVLGLITILQWTCVVVYASAWYSKLVGTMVSIVLLIGMIFCIKKFIKNSY